VHELKYVPSTGVDASGPDIWWGELNTDQRPDDSFSLVYDSAPLQAKTAILGMPEVVLQASATASQADWFARLSDVSPDGTVTMITGAGLNGAQRVSTTDPSDLEPGKVYKLDFKMHFTSWVFPSGHKMRLAISNAMWPMIWPTPYSMTTTLLLGGAQGSRFLLPVVPVQSTLPPPAFAPPEKSEELPGVRVSGNWLPGELWTKGVDEIHQVSNWEWHGGEETMDFPWGRERHQDKLTFKVKDDLSESPTEHGEGETIVELTGRTLVWRDTLDLRSDKTNFYYHFTRLLLENGKQLREKTWDARIPRDHQ
jgi:hypothetical protein